MVRLRSLLEVYHTFLKVYNVFGSIFQKESTGLERCVPIILSVCGT